jgi:methyl-accepting chemotaxis protein
MRSIFRVGLEFKMLGLVLGSLAATVILLAGIGVYTLNSAVTSQAEQSLIAVRELKKQNVENTLAFYRKQIRFLSQEESVLKAIQGFSSSNRNYLEEMEITPAQLSEMRSELRLHYEQQFASIYSARNNGRVPAAAPFFEALDDLAVALQHAFIVKNPHPVEERDQLERPEGFAMISSAHKRFHTTFKGYKDLFGYEDILLIDSNNGRIVYSVIKQVDFSASLLQGPLAETALSSAFQELRTSTDPQDIRFLDVEPYLPSYDQPSAFLIAPVVHRGRNQGVLAFQIPLQNLNTLMTSGGRWEAVGQGKTGETYIVSGDDLSMRSDPRMLLENPESYLELLAKQTLPNQMLEMIQGKRQAIMYQPADTDGVRAARDGSIGSMSYTNYLGQEVFGAYAPLKIEGVNWVILSEITEDELNSFATDSLIAFGLSALLATLLATVVSVPIVRRLSRTLIHLVKDLTGASLQLKHIALQLAESSHTLSEGSQAQALSINETTSSVQQVTQQTQSNAGNSRSALALMQNVVEMTNDSSQQADKAIHLSADAREAAQRGVQMMSQISRAMQEIREGSEAIKGIIGLIGEITHQTKMLATNAAIEAARAGEAGKGFAVVAEEVSRLAEHSKEASKQIATLIQENNLRAESGNEYASQGEGILKEILQKSNEVGKLIQEVGSFSQNQNSKAGEVEALMHNIRNASEHQALSISEINTALTEIGKLTQTNTENSRETALASQQLTQQISHLEGMSSTLGHQVGMDQHALSVPRAAAHLTTPQPSRLSA